jgi:NACHT domain
MSQRRKRGVQATDDGRKKLQQAKTAGRNEKGKLLTYENIADKADIQAKKTVERFFKGEAIEEGYAKAICQALGLKPIDIINPDEWNRKQQHSQSKPTAERKITEIYINWLQEITSHLIVPGIPEMFSMQSDWLRLRVKHHSKEQDQMPFKAKFIPELYRLSIVAGEPGSGKSTFTKYLAHHLASSGKTVLRVRLPSVCKLLADNQFGDAILRDAVGDSSLSLEQAQFALSQPDYLLADGLDECGDNRADISGKLLGWANGHSATRIIVTTRIDSEPEYLPGWQLLKLLPLEDSDTIKFAKRLLGDLFDETKFQSWLQTSEVIVLAAKNPLLLGFLIQIFREHDEPIQNRAKLYEKIIDLAYKQPLKDKELISLNKTTAKRIVEIIGWELLNSPQCSESDLLNNVGKKLKCESNGSLSLFEAKNLAEKGVLFWEQRRILERIKIRCDDEIVFLHLTIGEYAAGRYACEMKHDNFCQWLIEVNQNHMCREPDLFAVGTENDHDFLARLRKEKQSSREAKQNYKWRESILFAADLGKAETIINLLLQQGENGGVNESSKVLFSVEILRRIDNPSFELTKKVFDYLTPDLESPVQSIVFRTTKSILSLPSSTLKLTDNILQPFLQHSQSWTRLAAIRLSLASGNECIEVKEMEKQIDEIIVEIRQDRIDGFQVQFLVESFRFLFKNQPSLENCRRIKEAIDLGRLNTKQVNDLKGICTEKFAELSRLSSAVLEQEMYQYLTRIFVNFCDFNSLAKNLDRIMLAQKAKLEKLRFSQKNKSTDQLFLESILRVLENASTVQLQEDTPQEFLLLGILTTGMHCWEVRCQEWDDIGKYPNSKVVDAVIKGAIVAMDLDRHKLAIEAKVLLDRLERNFYYEDLDEIESILANPTDNLDKFNWACDQLSGADLFLFGSIIQLPANPQWDRVKSIELDIQTLIEALDHPSAIIKSNAYKILCQKIEEDRLMEIIQEKGLI